jgi:hypothetical protein
MGGGFTGNNHLPGNIRAQVAESFLGISLCVCLSCRHWLTNVAQSIIQFVNEYMTIARNLGGSGDKNKKGSRSFLPF